MSPADLNALVQHALEVRRRAYARYSGFAVGAALQVENGDVFTGVNVENASYGLTICAERTAVAAAVTAGQTRFEGLAIVTPGGRPPCGACRQVLAEFCDDLPILLVDADDPNRRVESSLGQLLPQSFGLRPGNARADDPPSPGRG